ncbi:unnamed protein product [Linum tenue]|uniref:Uncharacterized protein n=1 Tax=Linum tenue TaxID=586396 RepID=A0AAV0RQN9_9ROSI|nr:unnamed protein product [Linum tenue]
MQDQQEKDQLYCSTEHHKVVRQQVVDQLRSCPGMYEGYIPMPYNDYLTNMYKHACVLFLEFPSLKYRVLQESRIHYKKNGLWQRNPPVGSGSVDLSSLESAMSKVGLYAQITSKLMSQLFDFCSRSIGQFCLVRNYGIENHVVGRLCDIRSALEGTVVDGDWIHD